MLEHSAAALTRPNDEDDVVARLGQILSSGDEAGVASDYADISNILESNPNVAWKEEGVMNSISPRWLPVLVGSVSSVVRQWACLATEAHTAFSDELPHGGEQLIENAVKIFFDSLSGVRIEREPTESQLFPDEEEDDDSEDRIPLTHDAAVLWYAIYFLLELGGPRCQNSVKDLVSASVKNNGYLDRFPVESTADEARGWLLKTCLLVGAATPEGASEWTRPFYIDLFNFVLPSNIRLLCEFVALHPASVMRGHLEVLFACEAPTEEYLALMPLARVETEVGDLVASRLWSARHAQALLTNPRCSEPAAEMMAAVAGECVQSILGTVLQWTHLLATTYHALRNGGRVPEAEAARAVHFPRADLLFGGLAQAWEVLPAEARQQLADSVLPLAALLDANAFAMFLSFTRLQEHLPQQQLQNPMGRYTAICEAIDSLAEVALRDPTLARSTNILRCAFLLAPQHTKAHSALLSANQSSAESLVRLVSSCDKARSWIGVALRACCASEEGSSPSGATSGAFVVDVQMSIFARAAIGVINGLLEGLYPYVEPKYIQDVLMSTQRCLLFWRELGLSFETIMLGSVGVSVGPWCASILRAITCAMSDSESDRWAVAVATLAEKGAFGTQEMRGVFRRSLKKQPRALPAINRVSQYTPAAARLLAWAQGKEYPPDVVEQQQQQQQQQQRQQVVAGAGASSPGAMASPAAATPQRGSEKKASQDSLQAQYSLSMLDDDEPPTPNKPQPKLPPSGGFQKASELPPNTVGSGFESKTAGKAAPKRGMVNSKETSFLKFAQQLMPPAPKPPRLSKSEVEMRKVARLGGASSQAKVEIQACGAAWIIDKPKGDRAARVFDGAAGYSDCLVPQAFSKAVASADRKFLIHQQNSKESIIRQLRERRFPEHKRQLLKALLSVNTSSEESTSLPGLPQTFVSEDQYANTLFPYIVDEACQSVKRGLAELDFSAVPDAGAVTEMIDSRKEIVIELSKRTQNYYSDADLLALTTSEMSHARNAPTIIGKVEKFYRKHNQLQVRVNPGDFRRIIFGMGVSVQPVTRLSAVFHQNWVINHLAMLPLAQHLLTAAPVEDVHTRAKRLSQYISGIPPKFRDYLKRKFNDPQRDAIVQASAQRDGFTLIQGPPGTGKTTTIVGLVSLLLMQNAPHGFQRYKKVLIVAPSNTAIDEVGYRIASAGLRDAEGRVYNPRLVRLGVKQKVDPRLVTVHIDNIIDARCGQELDAKELEKEQVCRQMVSDLEKEELALKRMQEGPQPCDSSVLWNQRERVRLLRANIGQENKKRKVRAEIAEESRRSTRGSILEDATIVCTTLGSCRNIPGGFHAVVVDEAAQCVETDVLLALKSGAKHVVLVGDDKQLPATVLSTQAQKGGYDVSLFQRLREGGHVPLMLKTQFRMNPSIRAFPSAEFYGDSLLDHVSIVKRPKNSVLAYGVIHVEGQCVSVRGKSSVSNPIEADAVVGVVELIKQTLQCKLSDIGVITPYQAQVQYLRAKVSRMRPLPSKTASEDTDNSSVEVNTVDGFQGREKRAIVVSCVRAPGNAGQGLGFTVSPQRLNVALTRGREVVYVLMHAGTMSQNPMWGRLISNAGRRGLMFSQDDVRTSLPSSKKPAQPDLAAALASVVRERPTNGTKGGAKGRRGSASDMPAGQAGHRGYADAQDARRGEPQRRGGGGGGGGRQHRGDPEGRSSRRAAEPIDVDSLQAPPVKRSRKGGAEEGGQARSSSRRGADAEMLALPTFVTPSNIADGMSYSQL